MSATPAVPLAAARRDGVLPTQQPLRVELATVSWDRSCELLIVGLGAAGASCAIHAREAGADVLVVDRFDGGGATQRSGGVIYAGGGTPHQKLAGYNDTPDAMYRYLKLEVGDAVTDATLRRFCEDSRDMLAWVESLGVSFEVRTPTPKTSYPQAGWDLYYSGNEALGGYAEHAEPAPRGHRCHDTGMAGRVLYAALRKRVDALAIPVLQRSAVRRLIVDTEGRVLGAEVMQLTPGSAAEIRHRKLTEQALKTHEIAPAHADKLRACALAIEFEHARPLKVRAQQGVVLCTGGFIFDRERVARQAPAFVNTLRLGTTGCDGSGIRLGESVGGATARMHKVSAWRFINPPSAWPRAPAINQQGERFCNEMAYGAKFGVTMCEGHGGKGWLIIDSKLRWQSLREALFGGLWAYAAIPALFLALFAPRARTLAALAAKIGVPAAALEATVKDYNRIARGERADPLLKKREQMDLIERPPYFALNLAHSALFPLPAITLGGLRVDEQDGAVLRDDGSRIPGLHAAGRAAVGLASNGYVSGLSISDCLWSGRRAGLRLAEAAHDARRSEAA